MRGLRIDQGAVQLEDELLHLANEVCVVTYVQGLPPAVAIDNLVRQCRGFKSDGKICLMMSQFEMDFCVCAGILAQLHDLPLEELTEERFQFIMQHYH